MSDGLVKILDGNTFVVSDARGDIEASPTDPTGLFSFDTRFLSRWVLSVNGERLSPLSVDDLQYFETRFFLVPGTGTVYIDAKLSVIRRRAVGNGFHEDLTILNHAAEPVDLSVRVDAGCDFADLFEVKDALQKKGTHSAQVKAGRLVLAYDRETFGRSTAISASVPAKIDEGGLSEKTLNSLGDSDYEKIYVYPNSHAGYYPGAKPIAMKVLFRKSDGRLLGAQAIGEDGVDKRISTLALAIQMGASVYDLEEAELCYAPPFGSAKDPVNFAGMVAADILRGDMPISHWDSAGGGFVLDVREQVELAVEHVPDAVNIPLGELRSRLDELPRDREILTVCRSGQRAYYAARILVQNGFDAKVLSGGMLSHAMLSQGILSLA